MRITRSLCSSTALLPAAALCAALLVRAASGDQGCEYLLDDGIMEQDYAWVAEGATVQANQFTAAGCTQISVVRVRFSGNTVGLGVRAFVYEDPNDDGNPTDAMLLAEAATTVASPPGPFQDIAIGPVTVMGVFYVGYTIDTTVSTNVMAIDRSLWVDDPPSPQLSYIGQGSYSDDDPFLDAGPTTLQAQIANATGYLLIRALGNPVGLNNNEAADARIVGAVATSFNNTGATGSGFSCSGGAGSDVWFLHTAGGDGTLNVSATGFSTVIEVHEGSVPGTVLACTTNGAGGVNVAVNLGDELLIRVGGAGGAQGNGTLTLDLNVTSPANDVCSAAQVINPVQGGTVSVMGTNKYSTFDLEPLGLDSYTLATDCGDVGEVDGPGVWYRLQGTGNTITASLCNPGTNWPAGPEYDYSSCPNQSSSACYTGPRIVVFCNCPPAGACDGSSVCLFAVCVDGAQLGAACTEGGEDATLLPTVSWCSAANVVYYVFVGGDENSFGNFELSIADANDDCDGPPNCVVDNSNCLFPDPIAPGQTINGSLCNTPSGLLPIDLCGNYDSTQAATARWFEAVGDGTTWTASLCSGTVFDSGLAVYTGGCANLECAPGFFVQPDNCGFKPQETITFEAEYGVTYLIRVWVNFGSCNNFSLSLTSDGDDISPYTCPAQGGAPPNNCCSAPQVVNGPFPVSMAFNTTNASTDGIDADPTNPCNSANEDGQIWHDVWYRLTPAEAGDLTISICNGSAVVTDEDGQNPPDGFFDSKIAAYDVTAVPMADRCTEFGLLANLVGCNEDCPADPTSELTIPVLTGRTYYVRLGGFDSDDSNNDGEKGSGMIEFSFGGAPTPCPADTNNDGVVNVTDLTNVILAWGTGNPAADVNDDGIVNVGDLTAVILAWGNCPP